jgi:hypothetical protein
MDVIRLIFLDDFLFCYFALIVPLNIVFILCVIWKIQGRLI